MQSPQVEGHIPSKTAPISCQPHFEGSQATHTSERLVTNSGVSHDPLWFENLLEIPRAQGSVALIITYVL